MKFRVLFKTPDALDGALEEHMDTHCEECEEHDPECDECNALEDKALQAISQIKNIGEKFIEYGEYITIEFDTETQSATVVPLKKR